MKIWRGLSCLAAVAVLAGCASWGPRKEGEEASVKWAQLPAAVQTAVKQQVPESAINKIEKENEDGQVAYEVQVVKDGHKSEITVAADGRLLSVEEEVALAEVPAVVRQTVEAQAIGGKVAKIEKVTAKGQTIYEARVKKNGKALEFSVALDGKLTGTEDVTKEKD